MRDRGDRGSSLAKISSVTVFDLAKDQLYSYLNALDKINKKFEDDKERYNSKSWFVREFCFKSAITYSDYSEQSRCEEGVDRAENLMRISSHTEEPVYITPSDAKFLGLSRDG